MSLNIGRPRNEIDPRRIVEKVRSLDDEAAQAMIRSVIACTKATDGSEKANTEHNAEWAFWEAMNHYSAKRTLAADDDNGVSQYCRDVMTGLAEIWQAAKLHTHEM